MDGLADGPADGLADGSVDGLADGSVDHSVDDRLQEENMNNKVWPVSCTVKL